MIRMTVRYPYKFAIFDGMHLFIWYLMREIPATKIRTSFNPRISYQHGATIVANERRVANGFKTYIHCFPLSQRMTRCTRMVFQCYVACFMKAIATFLGW